MNGQKVVHGRSIDSEWVWTPDSEKMKGSLKRCTLCCMFQLTRTKIPSATKSKSTQFATTRLCTSASVDSAVTWNASCVPMEKHMLVCQLVSPLVWYNLQQHEVWVHTHTIHKCFLMAGGQVP